MIINFIQRQLNKLGLSVMKYPKKDKDKISISNIISNHKINKVFDVGANIGQYATSLRNYGYNDMIFSFEPLSKEFQDLKNNALFDHAWEVFNFGFGSVESEIELNISSNSYSSSILDIQNEYKGLPYSYIGKESIQLKRLDDVFPKYCTDEDNVLLKLDVQGYESEVLKAACETMTKIQLFQIELSIEELYEGELLYDAMISYLQKLGFKLIYIENGFADPKTNNLLQFDGLFLNTNRAKYN